MPANEVSTLPNASYPYSPHFQSLTAVIIRVYNITHYPSSFSPQYFSLVIYLPLMLTDIHYPEEAAAKAKRRRELMEQFFRLEDDYIRHHLDLEEREVYWREREEKLKKELEATQAYLRHIQEELGELEGVTDEDEDEDN
ncbi:hypothetical protein AlacWU_05543 [Aspergillus niger]|nr:hypothetical protein AlacWU_05543 [Aspergillus niger]